MQTFIFSILTLYIICSTVADAFLLPIKVKRRASLKSWSGTNEPGNSRVMDSFPSEKFPGYNILPMKKRAISYPSRRKRDYDTDYDNKEYAAEFYPYNNVGSLYVDGDRVEIKRPMFNFGVSRYGDPYYGPASDEDEELVE